MRYLLTLMLLASISHGADKFKHKVAVIDTGFSGFYATPESKKSLCKSGHYDFTTGGSNLGYDHIGHGTFVTNLITESSPLDQVCILVYKVDAYVREKTRLDIAKALVYAYKQGARAVNISMGHPFFSQKEERIFQLAANKGMVIFASAGNDGKNMNDECRTYPACYSSVKKNMYIVGSYDASGLIETYSNRGRAVHIYEYGSIPNVGRGTSFASPRALARYLREKYGNEQN